MWHCPWAPGMPCRPWDQIPGEGMVARQRSFQGRLNNQKFMLFGCCVVVGGRSMNRPSRITLSHSLEAGWGHAACTGQWKCCTSHSWSGNFKSKAQCALRFPPAAVTSRSDSSVSWVPGQGWHRAAPQPTCNRHGAWLEDKMSGSKSLRYEDCYSVILTCSLLEPFLNNSFSPPCCILITTISVLWSTRWFGVGFLKPHKSQFLHPKLWIRILSHAVRFLQ